MVAIGIVIISWDNNGLLRVEPTAGSPQILSQAHYYTFVLDLDHGGWERGVDKSIINEAEPFFISLLCVEARYLNACPHVFNRGTLLFTTLKRNVQPVMRAVNTRRYSSNEFMYKFWNWFAKAHGPDIKICCWFLLQFLEIARQAYPPWGGGGQRKTILPPPPPLLLVCFHIQIIIFRAHFELKFGTNCSLTKLELFLHFPGALLLSRRQLSFFMELRWIFPPPLFLSVSALLYKASNMHT